MGSPRGWGSVQACILPCHWHHARFDLSSGGTFDPWADDVRSFPVEIRGDEVWIDTSALPRSGAGGPDRLKQGLERDLSLVIAKSVLRLTDGGGDPPESFPIGLEFGTP